MGASLDRAHLPGRERERALLEARAGERPGERLVERQYRAGVRRHGTCEREREHERHPRAGASAPGNAARD
jgi:hypothetical protein